MSYTEKGYVELRNYYPLFYGTTMVAMALNMGEGCYQLETMLANAISKTGKKCGAIIYDKNACNLSNNDNIKHACVISGVNLTAGFITILDPAGGTYTVYQSGSTYSYVPSYAGYTLTLNILVCRLSS